MNICILIPTAGEARSFIAALKMRRMDASSFAHEAPGASVVLHVCGMGVENARRQAEAVLNQGTDSLVLAGICGGLRESLRVGDVVIDTQCPDPDFTNAVMRLAKARNIPIHLGAIFTSPRLLAKPEDKIQAGIQSTAIAVDMEGDGVLELCRARNLPFRSFRTVSDGVQQRLPGALRHITLDDKAPLRFWCALVCRVWEWPGVCRMLWAGRLARKNLAAVLADWVQDKTDSDSI